MIILKNLIAILGLLMATQYVSAQNEKDIATPRPAYLEISLGVQSSTFRDFATSPLFYTGNLAYVSLSHTDFDANRASSFRLSYASGHLKTSYVDQQVISKVNVFTINYIELFQLFKGNSPNINVKVGGQLNTNANIRDNESLGNNSKGFEVISTLFGAAKGTIVLSGEKEKRKSELALGINLGLINSAYRNGFIYTRQSPLLNQDHINEGYQFRIFSGYRLNSFVDYTLVLKNKNAVQLSYLWDVYRTGGGHDEIEMASHLLKLSIMVNLKYL